MANVYFVDTSALSKRYVDESGSSWLRSILSPTTNCTAYIVRITAVELIAALTRRERGGSISPSDAHAARSAIRAHIDAEYKVIEVTEALIEKAMILSERYGIRGYDAVQLAGAVEVNNRYAMNGLPPITLISADQELNDAATAQGLTVEDPNLHIES